jgi:asparagine synthase (glutamine-hydrolysing)
VGIAGVAPDFDESLVAAMRDSLAHRGPDAFGSWRSPDRQVLLGHRRLSIVDLSSSGAQPMVCDEGRLAIVFNGEIYNHQELREELRAQGASFRGRSDTEVLLNAYRHWREKCVHRLRGMFAFAIYDADEQTMFLARDRAGEKPLYWGERNGTLVFASELKAIMLDPSQVRRIEPLSQLFYLSYGYVPAERCILKGIHKLQPAHWMKWSLLTKQVVMSRYWDVPPPVEQGLADKAALTTELHELLKRSVAEQLEADVPVAVLLSGGIDSSVVTAIAASVSRSKVRTYTVSIPGHPRFDEAKYAKRVSEHFDTDHMELALGEASIDVMRLLAGQFDEPICDSSMIPTYLLAKTVSEQCKVVLGGDGGDELFGGYRMYQGALKQTRLRSVLPGFTRSAVSLAARRWLPPGANGRNGLIGLRGEIADGIAQTGVMFDDGELHRLAPWAFGLAGDTSPKRWRRQLVEPGRGMPGAAMVADFRSYMAEDILVKVDRASMLCSLEVRAPLLDYRIIEFAYRNVPNRFRATESERKLILKELAARLLPADLDLNRKQGFSIPLSQWLTRDVLRAWSEECREQIKAVLSEREVHAMIAQERAELSERLFGLVLLTLWMRHYRISV